MCTRIEAIQVVISNQYGRKSDLIDKISLSQYKIFVSTGLIRELVRMPHSSDVATSVMGIREWVATPFAFERANTLNVKADKRFLFQKKKKTKRKMFKLSALFSWLM
ncbi:MAG: hypothetical protein K2J48_03965 [Muribaculaceae bacterium]|nr:hypothetical protein [Muribaculaceae bacterium]